MSNESLAAQLRAFAAEFDANAALKNENVTLKLRLILLFFGERFFSSAEMLGFARAAVLKGLVYTDMILGADGGVFVGRPDEAKAAESLKHFEALCLELAAPAEKEGAA